MSKNDELLRFFRIKPASAGLKSIYCKINNCDADIDGLEALIYCWCADAYEAGMEDMRDMVLCKKSAH